MIGRNIVANFVGIGWATLVGVAVLPIYVRYLGVEAFGLIGIFAVVQAWLALLDAGVTPALTRETSRLAAIGDDGEIRRVLRTSEGLGGAAGFISFLLLAAASILLANNWLHPETLAPRVVAQSFVLMGVVIGIRFAENVYRA